MDLPNEKMACISLLFFLFQDAGITREQHLPVFVNDTVDKCSCSKEFPEEISIASFPSPLKASNWQST